MQLTMDIGPAYPAGDVRLVG